MLLARAECPRDDHRELVLQLAGVGPLEERLRFVVGRRGDEVAQRRLQPVEHRAHLVGAHSSLEVVEEDVVRVAGRREAVDVAVLELERPVEPGAEAREVVLGPRRRPGVHSFRGELRQLGRQQGRDAAGFLPVTARDCDQAGVVRFRVELRHDGLELGEQLADLVAHEELVRKLVKRRERVRPGRRAT